ncbi:hypothetical protein ACFL4G_04975 [Thermodesulfobacteriota bacterium]
MKATASLSIAELSTWVILFLVVINAASTAIAAVDCPYQSYPPSEAIQRINAEMEIDRELIADYENMQRNDLVRWGFGVKPLDEVVEEFWVDYVAGKSDLERFQKKIMGLVNQIKLQKLMLEGLRDNLEDLSRCHTEIASTMDQERTAARNALILMTEVAESEQLSPFSTKHYYIEKSERGVTYELDSPTCAYTSSWSLSGVPQTLEPGQVFTITMNGNASGKCFSAGGRFGAGRLDPKGGLTLMSGPAQNKVVVGVPQQDRPARPGQVASNSAEYQLRLQDGSKEATLEFRVHHGSGTKLVATYSWR